MINTRIILRMAQHGVKRVRYSREALEAKRERDKAKLQEYLALTEDIISRVSFSRCISVNTYLRVMK